MEPPKTISSTSWATHLENVANAKLAPKAERKSLFSNKQGEYALFKGKKEARQENFTTKVRFAEIVRLTEDFFKECSEASRRYQAAVALKKLAYHKFHKLSESRARLKTKNAFALAVKFHPSYLRCATPEQLNRLGSALAKTESVVRSKEGLTGVYYLITDDERTLALKLPMNPLSHILADRFYRKMGFATPCYAAIAKVDAATSDPAAVICQQAYKVLEKGLSYLEQKRLKDPNAEMHLGLLKLQMNRPYLTFMEVMNATNMGDLTRDELKKIINHPAFLHQLGEMLFLDRFLNNTDRLTEERVNLGNFMLLHTETQRFSIDQKIIALLDHDFNILEQDVDAILAELEKLRSKEGIKTLIEALLRVLNTDKGPSDSIQLDNIEWAIKRIQEGVEASSRQLLEISDETLAILLDVPELDKCPVPDLKAVKTLLKNIAFLTKKN